MKTIQLNRQQVTMVDDEDFSELNKYKWTAHWSKSNKSYYVERHVSTSSGGRTTEQMSRKIMGLKHGNKMQVDHINHDTLDNRKENLRIVTNRENCQNKRYKSKYGIGIYYDYRNKKNPYQVQVMINGKLKSIGYYCTPEEAKKHREEFILENVKSNDTIAVIERKV